MCSGPSVPRLIFSSPCASGARLLHLSWHLLWDPGPLVQTVTTTSWREEEKSGRSKNQEARRKKEESRTFHSNLETLTWKVGNRWLNHHSLWFPDDLSIFKYHTFGLNQQNIGSKQRTLAVLHMEPQVRSNTFHQGFGLGRGTSLHSLSLLLIDSIHSCPFYHVLSLGTRFSDG